MRSMLDHLAHAARALRRTPAFTIAALATLALGIGATTAIFSVAHAVLLRPLPYRDADRLVLMWTELRARELRDFPFPPGDYNDLREHVTAFEEIAGVIPGRQALRSEDSPPEQLQVANVTPNLLSLLGAPVILGRDFLPDDARPQPPPDTLAQGPPVFLPQMVVLSHGLWQRRFGSDPNIIGRRIDLGFAGAEVVGVLAPGFELHWPPGTGVDAEPDVFSAARIDYDNASRINVSMRIVARLRPNATLAQATTQLGELATDLRSRFPIKEAADVHYYVEPMHDDLVADVRPAIVILLGAVALVLLIACANVANLLLVRAASRERELAVRSALGGSSWHVALPLLAEVALLAIGGAALGVLFAEWGVNLLVSIAPANLPRLDEIGIDATVLGFTTLVTLLAALVFGLAPMLRASRPDLAEALRAGRTPGIVTGRRFRQGVVLAEVALTFVLLVGGGLMIRSFMSLMQTDPGYDPQGILTFVAGLQSPEADARRAFQEQLADRLRGLPGVTTVTAANPLPLDGGIANARWGTEEAAADPNKFEQANARAVLPGYFEAMRTPLLAGRAFTEEDNREESTDIVIDDVLAEKAFPGRSAVGQQLLVRIRSNEPELLTVIGVVRHQRHETLAADGRETIFVTDGFLGTGAANRWAVRVDGNPASIAPAVRRIVNELDSRTPVSELEPMESLVDRAMAPTRFALALIGLFAVIAAILTAVGLYGVLATAVRQRTTELGVRLALGATAASVFRLVVGEGLRLSAIGIAVGVIVALVATRVMQSILIGVEHTDPGTFVSVAILFLTVAVLASWFPARRAAALDPTEALRGE